MAEPTGLVLIAGLLLVKEAGLPIPVPGDLVVIGAGVAAGRGQFDPVTALLVIVVAGIVGGLAQYALLRSVARPTMLRLVGRLGGTARVGHETERLRRGGARSVAIARSTPGIRIVAIAASALAGVPTTAFLAGLVVGNTLFVSLHFALGYLVGEPILAAAGGLLGPITIAVVGLAIVGGIGWWLLTRRRRRWRGQAAGDAPTGLATVAAWADACCPACLTLAAIDRAA